MNRSQRSAPLDPAWPAVVETGPEVRSAAAPKVPSWHYELAVVRVLWWRDMVRFFRQRSRVLGALVQPLILWAVIGSGFGPSFRLGGAEGTSYQAYFFPGITTLIALFTSIFSTMSLIEDRHQGFLQAVLAAPGSRASLVLGKTLGGTSLSMIQVLAVLLLAPLAGFSFADVSWLPLVSALFLVSFALSAAGFAVAFWLDSVQGYHAVMSVLLLPAWIVSGAMFPVVAGQTPAWVATLVRFNPLAHAVTAVRRSLHGGHLPAALENGSHSAALELVILLVLSVVAFALATSVARRKDAS